jgi:hypothetical protein
MPQPKPVLPQFPPRSGAELLLVKKLDICFSEALPQTGQGAWCRSAIARKSSNFFPHFSHR